MESRTKGRIGLTADVISLAVFAFAGISAVTGGLFSLVEPVMALGWGAVGLAGIGAACVVAFALSALMVGADAAATCYRRFRPSPAAPSSPVPASGGPAPSHTDQVQPALAPLRKDVDRAMDAIRHNASATREEGEALREAIRKEAKHAIEQGQKREEAFGARLKDVAEAAERSSTAVFEVLRDTYGPKFEDLDGKIGEYAERLGGRHRDLETALREFRRQVFDILRARDDAERLRKLDTRATELFDKLFFAKERDYPNEDAWRGEYLNWKGCIENYWAILRGHSESVGEPFASLTEADFDGKNGIPGNPLFARDGMRVLYQIMLVVNERHANLRDSASVFMGEKCRPPANPV